MKKIFSLALLNFKEAARDKFFFGVIFFFFFYLGFCAFLGKLSVGYSLKVLQDAGIIGIELTAVVLVTFSFIFGFFREKESRIIQVYLSNFTPLEVVTGKILGYAALSFFYLVFAGAAFCLISTFYGKFLPLILAALYPIFLKMLIIVCIASLFSTLFSSSTVALLAALFVYLSSEALPSALAITNAYGGMLQKKLLRAIYFILPNADKFEINNKIFYSGLPTAGYFIWITLYSLVYIFIVWLINLFVFQKKEY
ncbi:MAG: hypothetical protein PHU64_04145 [Candidatus Omnitrophica bacterium]|nr:hypothetical protein [Candidatus Omnitrophota bacterium]MDD5429263.1 hypothetical protein [Candidatus Omnitrophota bacterium]